MKHQNRMKKKNNMAPLRYMIDGISAIFMGEGKGWDILEMMSILIVIPVQLPFRLHLQDKVTLLIEFVFTLENKNIIRSLT